MASVLSLTGVAATHAAEPVLAPGGVLQRFKQYGSAPTLDTVKTDIVDGGTFDSQTLEPLFEFGPNGSNEAGANYGNVLSGILVPPVSGDYVFFVSGDDNINLYLSTDADPANKKLIAREPQWNNARDWLAGDRRAADRENRSDTFVGSEWAAAPATITLEAGQQYYIEAIHQEGGGGDSVGVAWRTPLDLADPANGTKPISGRYIHNLVDLDQVTLEVTRQPENTTVEELSNTSLSANGNGWKGISVQWEKSVGGGAFTEINGATDTTLRLTKVALSDNGAKFRAVLYTAGGKKETQAATLTVSPSTGPKVVGVARGSATLVDATVVFTKPMDATSASNPANYTADGGLSIVSATLINETTVVLGTSKQVEGQIYNISIAGVKDQSAAGTTVPAGTKVSLAAWKLFPGGVRHDFFQFGFTPNVQQVRDAVANGVTPTFSSVEPLAEYGPNGSNESGGNYGNRLSGWFTAPESGNYIFYVSGDDNISLYLSTDASPANGKLIAREPEWNNARDWVTTARRAGQPNRSDVFDGTEWETGAPASIFLEAGSIHYFEAFHQEGGGGDSVGITYKLEGEDDPATGSAPRLGADNVGLYLEPSSLSFSINRQPEAQTVQELGKAAFSVNASALFRINYQWERAEPGSDIYADIAGATGSSLALTDVPLSDSGAKFRCKLTTFGNNVVTDAAVLTVVIDKTAPGLSCATVSGGLSSVFVSFTERVTQESAENIANYVIDGVTISGAVLGSNRDKVVLTTSPLNPGAIYAVKVSNVKDISSTGNSIAPSSAAGFIAAGTSYRDAILVDGPIAYFPFDEPAGETVAVNLGSTGDTIAGTYNGTGSVGDEGPRPPEFVGFGSDNGAPTFNGTDFYVDTGAQFLSNLPAFTLEYWVKPAAFTATRVGIVGQNDAVEYGFISPNTIQIWTPGGGSLDTPYTFERDTWHHVASIGTGRQLQTYFDGVLINTGGGNTGNYGSSAFNVKIGGGGVFDGTGNFFTGQIDEVAIFDKALTAEQVRSHFLAAKEGPTPALKIASIEAVGANIVINWICVGTLEKAENILGPWTAIGDATTSPYTGPKPSVPTFYRLRN